MLGLSADELLTTTRAVRRRLDFDRPVDPGLITECLDIALQAPSGGNRQDWVWMVVADPAKKAALAGLYRQAWAAYRESPYFPTNEPPHEGPAVRASFERIADSAQYLSDNLERAPLFLIPCLAVSRVDRPSWGGAASRLGSVIQASWSFMLAARERGLGTCWTTLHLAYEQQAAEILGIPYDECTQVALIPIAHTIGTDFRPGMREPLDKVLHWDEWKGAPPPRQP